MLRNIKKKAAKILILILSARYLINFEEVFSNTVQIYQQIHFLVSYMAGKHLM